MKLYKLLSFLLLSTCLFAQKGEWQFIQWSCEVESCTQEYLSADYSPQMAIGLPDAFLLRPDALPNSHVMGLNQSAGKEEEAELKVKFCWAQKINKVVIAESHAPGVITKVFAYDESGKEYLIYSAEAKRLPQLKRLLEITLPTVTSYNVASIKIVSKPTIDGLFNAIDGVGVGEVEGDVLVPYFPKNLSYNINSKHEESNPVLSSDGKTIYFSRMGDINNVGYTENKKDVDIWMSTMDDNGIWAKAAPLDRPFNNKSTNIVIKESKGGEKIYVHGQYDSYGIYVSKGLSYFKRDAQGVWKAQQIMINGFTNTSSKVAYDISDDERIIVMAISNKGNAQLDLFVSFREDGVLYSKPKYMGSTLNSGQNEFLPRISSDNKTIYFASEGHGGYGGYDIYKSNRIDESWVNWSLPVNLGKEINTDENDSSFFVDNSQAHIYMIDRKDTYGEGDIIKKKLK